MKNRTTYHRTSDRATTAPKPSQDFADLLRVYTGVWTFQKDPRTGAWVAGPAPRPIRTYWNQQDPGPQDETPLTNEMNR